MKRKNIAVCVTGYDWEYESRVVYGIYERCHELDINLLTFACLTRRPELNSDTTLPEEVIRGESEIFNLINYDIMDGIIILGDSMIKEDLIYDIANKAERYGVPIVNINDPKHPLQYNIELSDKIAMEFVVRHLIEAHGVRKINFIGGFPGNLQTEERLAAYKKVLNEYNIPYDENRVDYGHFWNGAYDCTARFMESENRPEAIVCASDTMAIFTMEYLKDHGYRVPEDVIVTGFDGIKDCEIYRPSITSVRRAFQAAGSKAVDLLCRVWNGEKTENTLSLDSELLLHRSCGCECERPENEGDYYNELYGEQNMFRAFNKNTIESNSKLANARSAADVYGDTVKTAEFFSLKRMYICICSNIEEPPSDDSKEAQTGYKGLSETMISMVKFHHSVPVGTKFSVSKLVPEDILNNEAPVFFAFSPLYFKDSFLGYIAYEPSKIQGVGDLFSTWTITVSNNAGSCYMKNELEYVVNKLAGLYVRDPLTNLYNRRGMDRFGGELVEKAKLDDSLITIVCADIDNLKPINDLYGHEAGDNAIVRTAQALSAAMPQNSVCTRTGGDEFCIILSAEKEDKIKEYIRSVDIILGRYNENSGMPYKVGCSCGYYTVKARDITVIDEALKFADAEMYKVKMKKKTNRG